MNSTQIKYARQRAETAFSNRKKALDNKHRTPGRTLTKSEKLFALSMGSFTIVSSNSNYWYNDVCFTDELGSVFNQDGYTADLASLTAAYNTLLDELILGDCTEALRLLEAFAAAA